MGAPAGRTRLSWDDLQHAKMTEEIGLAQPVEYTEAERRTIATHEAGHATVAWLVGKSRTLEVLTIVKRRDALGLLSHSETEERFTATRTEVRAMIDIAFGGMVAEELFFGESSTGVASDLQAATTHACQMVGLLGMGNSLISVAAIESRPAGSSPASWPPMTAVPRSRTSCRRKDIGVRNARGVPLRGRSAAGRPPRPQELIGGEILDVIRSAGPGPRWPSRGCAVPAGQARLLVGGAQAQARSTRPPTT